MKRVNITHSSAIKSIRLAALVLPWIVAISRVANVKAFNSINRNSMIGRHVTRRTVCGSSSAPALTVRSSQCSDSSRHFCGVRDSIPVHSALDGKSKRKKLHVGAAAASIVLATLMKPAAALGSTASTFSGSADLANSYHLSRILFLRLLGVVYIAAFSVAKNQNKGLIGGETCVHLYVIVSFVLSFASLLTS